jgi:hypothetical protein
MAKLNGRRVFTACIEHIAVGSLSFIAQVKIDLGAFIPKPNKIAWSDPGSRTRFKGSYNPNPVLIQLSCQQI